MKKNSEETEARQGAEEKKNFFNTISSERQVGIASVVPDVIF